MKIKSTYLFVLFLILFFNQSYLHAQKSIKGKIKDTDGYGLAFVHGVIIQDSTVITDFLSDSIGNWKANLNTSKVNIMIHFKRIGCRDTIIPIQINQIGDIEITTKMNCNLYMPEIVVKDKKIGVVLHGDTLKFNIGFYNKGNEKTLGEVLKNLPGITISSENQIEYKGKRIDALLIEGKNIFNNQHKLANEGVSAKDILSIQIIEQYESFSQKVFQGTNDQIALNVVLKEGAKSKLKGNTELSVGYNKKQQAILSLFKVEKKRASTTFLRYNNIGQQLISQNDYMSLQTNLQRQNQSTLTDIDKILNSTFNMSRDVYINNDFLISHNGEISSDSSKFLTRYTFLGSLLNRNSKSNVFQNYFNQNNSVDKSQQNDSKSYFGNIQLVLAYKPRKNIKAALDLHADIKRPEINFSTSTNIGNDIFLAKTKNTSSVTSLNPEFYTTIELDRHWSIKVQHNFLLKRIKDDNLITDNKGIVESNILTFNQKTKNITIKHESSLNLFYVSSIIDAGIRHLYHTNKEDYYIQHLPSIDDFIEGNSLLNESLFSLNSFITFKYRRFSISPSLSYPYRISRVLNGISLNKERFNPSLMIKYAYGKVNFALFQYNSGYKFAEHGLMSNLPYIQNSRNIIFNQIPPEQIVNLQSVNLSHLYLNLVNKSKVYFKIQLSEVENPFIISTKTTNNFIEKKAIIAKSSTSINIINNIILSGYEFPISFSGNLIYNRVQTEFYDRPQSDILNLNMEVGVITKWKYPFQIETSFGVTQNKMKFGTISTGMFYTYDYNLDIQYNHQSINIETGFSLNQNYFNERFVNSINNLNVKIQVPFKEKFNFTLKGFNLLNLNGIENTFFTNTEFFNEISTYSTFPGYILFGINYRL